MPTIKPTEYMFEHYSENGKKEKWEVYADVLRNIYLEIGNFKISEATFRESAAYSKMCEEYQKQKKTKKV